jgi:nitric oxide reductase NorE protein
MTDEPATPLPAEAKSMPGEAGIWIIIFGDMMFFALFFGTYLFYRAEDVALYTRSQQSLNLYLGLTNTIILLTSSWLVVWAINCAKAGVVRECGRLIMAAIALGLGFWGVKIVEYSEKISAGKTIVSNAFFGFYYMFTGIHLLHVTVGIAGLAFAHSLVRKNRIVGQDFRILQGVGVFWHMVDLLWIVLFALLYLVH